MFQFFEKKYFSALRGASKFENAYNNNDFLFFEKFGYLRKSNQLPQTFIKRYKTRFFEAVTVARVCIFQNFEKPPCLGAAGAKGASYAKKYILGSGYGSLRLISFETGRNEHLKFTEGQLHQLAYILYVLDFSCTLTYQLRVTTDSPQIRF